MLSATGLKRSSTGLIRVGDAVIGASDLVELPFRTCLVGIRGPPLLLERVSSCSLFEDVSLKESTFRGEVTCEESLGVFALLVWAARGSGCTDGVAGIPRAEARACVKREERFPEDGVVMGCQGLLGPRST